MAPIVEPTAISVVVPESVVCGGSGPYRTSDLVQGDYTIFQWAHELLNDRFVEALISVFTGFRTLSNGTLDSMIADSPVARLVTVLNNDPVLQTDGIQRCNDYPGIPYLKTSLCGTTNTRTLAKQFSVFLFIVNSNCK